MCAVVGRRPTLVSESQLCQKMFATQRRNSIAQNRLSLLRLIVVVCVWVCVDAKRSYCIAPNELHLICGRHVFHMLFYVYNKWH